MLKYQLKWGIVGLLGLICLFSSGMEGMKGWTPEQIDQYLENQKDENRRANETHKMKIEDRKGAKEDKERDRLEKARNNEYNRKKDKLEQIEKKCEKADKEINKITKDKKQERDDLEEKFHLAEEEITKLNNEVSEKQTRLNELLEKLKRDTSELTQNLKDQMGQELDNIDGDISRLEGEINLLHEQMAKLEDARIESFMIRRNEQNDFYRECFDQTLIKVENERTAFHKKVQEKTLKRKSSRELFQTGKKEVKSSFANRFNQIMHICLNNQSAILKKKNLENRHKTNLKLFNRQETRAKKKIVELKEKIKSLNSSGKVKVMNRYKELMQKALDNFSSDHDLATNTYKRQADQSIAKIEKIKQKQASFLMKRAQAVPDNARQILVQNQCEAAGTGGLNLFKGNFNSSSNSYEEYADDYSYSTE